MNGIVARMIDTQMLLFLYMLCGFVISRLNIIRDSNRSALVRLLMDVAMPMMVLNAFNKPTTMEQVLSSLMVIVISLLGCVVTGLFGLVLWRNQPDNKRKVLMYASLVAGFATDAPEQPSPDRIALRAWEEYGMTLSTHGRRLADRRLGERRIQMRSDTLQRVTFATSNPIPNPLWVDGGRKARRVGTRRAFRQFPFREFFNGH